ncbi:hypothetical protein DV515_00004286, partial [Chloebia gouldiae]
FRAGHGGSRAWAPLGTVRGHRDRERHRDRGHWDHPRAPAPPGWAAPRPPAPQPPRASGARRLELGRQRMEYTTADPHLVRQRLQRRLEAVSARQQLALHRNQALCQEFLQLEAHMEATGWESIRKMEVTSYKTWSWVFAVVMQESPACSIDSSAVSQIQQMLQEKAKPCGFLNHIIIIMLLLFPKVQFGMLQRDDSRFLKLICNVCLYATDAWSQVFEEAQSEREMSSFRLSKSNGTPQKHLAVFVPHTAVAQEWYGREIKNLLSLQEGSLSAGGDKEEGPTEQVLQTRGQVEIGTNTAMPGELGYPALLGCLTSAASATGGLGAQQKPPLCSPSSDGLSPETGNAAGESEEGAAGHGDLAASEEGSEQLTSASGAKAAPPRPGSDPGAKPSLSSWWTRREQSRVKLPVPASAEEVRPNVPSLQQERGRDAQAPECSLLPPPNPPAAQEEPLDSSAPHRLLEGLVERMSPRHRALYQGQPSAAAEQPGACAGASRLAQGDLEVMEATVLQQLQAVSQCVQSRSLPLENTGEAVSRAGYEEHTRDTDALQSLLSHHSLFLKHHWIQFPERVAGMFEQPLALGEEGQDHQTVPVLRDALPGECGDEPPVLSDESSLSLPLIPTNDGEGKQGELARQEPGEDRGHDSPEGSGSLGTHLESSSLSDGSTPPFSRTELRKETLTAIKSKAFWGESDDSCSELEAALRPQTHSTDSDDFDDYD